MKKLLAIVLALLLVGAIAMAAPKVIRPIDPPFDPNNVADGVWPAAFDPAKITVNEDGTATVEVTFGTEEMYDLVDISKLSIGDTVISEGNEIVVEKIMQDGNYIDINDGYNDGGLWLTTGEDSNGYRSTAYDNIPLFHDIGKATMTISKDVVYNDTSEESTEPERDAINVTGIEAMLEGMHFHEEDFHDFKDFMTRDTTVTVENGVITAIHHEFVP